jgi:hypothetical protein
VHAVATTDPIVATQAPTTPPAEPVAPPPEPPTRAELEATADRIRDADNDDAKIQTLATELDKLDESSRATLMAVLTEKEGLDNGLSSGWFNANAIHTAAGSGAINAEQESTIADAFTASYNRGANVCLLDPSTAMDQVSAAAFISADYPSGEYYANVNAVNQFLLSGDDAQSREFVENWSQAELERLAANGDSSWSPGQAERVVHLLAGAGSAQSMVKVLDGLGPEARAEVFDLLSHAYQPQDGYPQEIKGWAHSDDALAIVIEGVASQSGQGQSLYVPGVPYAVGREASVTAADRIALELVRYAGQHEDEFFNGQDAYDARATAMADLLVNHQQFLLDQLSDPRFGQFTEGSSTYSPEALSDVLALGTVLRMTTMGDDVPAWKQQQVQSAVLDYTRAQVAAAPGPDAAPSPTGRVGMVLMASQDAVKQGYASLEDQRAAQQRFVGFFSDILVDQLAKAGGTLTPQGKLVEIVGGEAIDMASEAGKEFLREKVTDFLFGAFDTGDLDDVQARVNTVVGGFVQSLPDGQESTIGTFMLAMSGAINDAR